MDINYLFDCPCGERHDIRYQGMCPGYTQLTTRIEMDFTTFVRKPFVVEAVEVTAENINEVAKYIGDVREREDGTQYILVDRRLVPNVFKVYPGFFMTKMGENIRCYSRKIFKEQFIEKTAEVQPWIDFMDQQAS
jgi:hypothetical protein